MSEKSRAPIFEQKFRDDLLWWFKNDQKRLNKILDLVEVVCQDPYQGIGKPEPLKYLEANTWSRRIDLEHRLVYQVTEELVYFIQCRYHY